MKRWMALFLGICCIFAITACKKEEEEEILEPEDPNFPITIEWKGQSATIYEAPNAVVSVSPAITELFYDLEEEHLLQGVSSYAPKKAQGKTDCGTAQQLDLSAIKELKADLLFTDTPLLAEQLIQLQQMDVEVIVIERPTSMEEIEERAELICLSLYGKEDGAQKAQDYLQRWTETCEPLKLLKQEEEIPALLLADLSAVATGDTWESTLLELLDFQNICEAGENWALPEESVAEDGTVHYFYEEGQVLAWNPAVILYHSDLDVEEIKADLHYQNSTAVANNALYPLDWTAVQFQSLDLAEELAEIAEQYAPEQWQAIQEELAAQKEKEQELEEQENTEENQTEIKQEP